MDSIVNLIMSCSSDLNRLSEELRVYQHFQGTLTSPMLDGMLAALDPKQHAYGMLWLLTCKLPIIASVNDTNFIQQVASVIFQGTKAQLQRSYQLIELVSDGLLVLAHRTNSAARIVPILKTGLKMSVPNLFNVTKLHTNFIQACLLAKHYKAALDILNFDILEVNDRYQVKIAPVLQYFYYGGLVYTGLKDWKRALYFFQLAITVPSDVVSMVSVESYKKYALVSVLCSGQLEPLPKYTSSPVLRYIKTKLSHYTEFAEACAALNYDKASNILNADFARDKSFGLAKQCLASIHNRIILRLTKTFITLSLADIASHTKLPSAKAAEKAVLKMIESGEISARINQRDGMVSFLDTPSTFDTPETIAAINARIAQAMALYRKVTDLSAQVVTSLPYLQRTTDKNVASSSVEHEEMEFEARAAEL